MTIDAARRCSTRDLAGFEPLLGARMADAGRSRLLDRGVARSSERGIDAVVFGPGDVAQAHAADEYVEIAELEDGRAPRLRARAAVMEAEIVQRFLESVGAKADIDLYLRLHRAQRKESFAMLAPNAQIVKSALDPLHFDLRILAGLGLVPVVVLGVLEPKDADAQATRVSEWLVEDDVPCEIVRATATRPARQRRDASPRFAPSSRAARSRWCRWRRRQGAHDRGALPAARVAGRGAGDAQARVPQPAAGPGAERRRRSCRWSAWRPTPQRLLAPGALPRGQAMLLRQVKQLVEAVPQRLSVTVVNPLQLLRELFTVNGAGTLIRRGSRIDVHTSWDGIDRARIEALFASAFERPVRARLLRRSRWRAIFVEENYSGAAVVQETPVAPYLTKFAVERQAQGEGIGGELWSLLARDFPASSGGRAPANPITAWYGKQCDGFARFPEWHVFWRGLAAETIEPAIRYALALPSDFA